MLPGSKIPDWYDPDYKNETTPESQKELERIKQESLDKMKISTKNRKLSKLRVFYVVLFGRVLFFMKNFLGKFIIPDLS